jgi:hypothetical protein
MANQPALNTSCRTRRVRGANRRTQLPGPASTDSKWILKRLLPANTFPATSQCFCVSKTGGSWNGFSRTAGALPVFAELQSISPSGIGGKTESWPTLQPCSHAAIPRWIRNCTRVGIRPL